MLNSEIIRSLALDNIPIAISLDGSTKEEHEFIRGRNTYDRTIRNIREAVSNGVDVNLFYSIHKGNQDKTVQFLEFSKQLGVKTVNYSFLNEIGNAYTNHLLNED